MPDSSFDPVRDIRPLVRRLRKPPSEWRRRDLAAMVLEDGIRVVDFHYPSFDGKLRELRLPVTSPAYLDRILAAGERVDGSSLHPGLLESGASDLYVVPVYRWAFLDPWSPDELHVVCRFAERSGAPSPLTPDNLLASAAAALAAASGFDLLALAELELYLILERHDERFTGRSQRNYHQSAPYLHGHAIADEILRQASAVTGCVKYCHAEVGYIDRLASSDPELDGRRVEQYEIELDLAPIEDLGCWLSVLRWLVRRIADRHGASVTFVPKLDEGMAGSGMHLHLALERGGVNAMLGADGELSEPARRLVGGLLRHAPALAAFGNTVAGSYLRLVPDQEAPTHLCWGRSDRSALVRVPLDFATARRLDQTVNPHEDGAWPSALARPTVELRSPDGSAFPQLLLAAVTLAVADGLADPSALELAAATESHSGRVARPEIAATLGQLPRSAVEAARRLEGERAFFERGGFPPRLIDRVVGHLRAEADEDLSARLRRLPAAERLVESRRLMHKDLHKH
jgi:glutamine synthetase